MVPAAYVELCVIMRITAAGGSTDDAGEKKN